MFDEAGALSRAYLSARGTCCSSGCRNCPYGGRALKCGRCGVAFTCDVGEACWCHRVAVPAEALAEMRAKYDDCLCPGCLAALAGSPVKTGL